MPGAPVAADELDDPTVAPVYVADLTVPAAFTMTSTPPYFEAVTTWAAENVSPVAAIVRA